MSIVLSNLNNFLFESEIKIDDNFISMFEGLFKTSVKGAALGAAGAAAGVGAAKIANMNGISTDSDIIGKTKNLYYATKDHLTSGRHVADAEALKDASGITLAKKFADERKDNFLASSKALGSEIANSPVAHLAGIGAVAAIGAGALFKYKNSIYRLNYLLNHYSLLASHAKTPAERQKYENQISNVKNRLSAAQSKARIEHKNFIEKSQRIQSYINELNKTGRKQDAARLQEKLDKRQKFLSKIGATI